MELGVHVINFNYPDHPASIAPSLKAVGEVAETIGLTSISVMDHYFQMDQMAPATDPMLEGYTTLGFLAAHTSTVQLGLLVTGVTYRHPGLLAKTVATLDVLSSGRAQLGIGAAWYEREHLGLGVPFPPVAERFERLEEALQICLQMWSGKGGRYDGKHYVLEELICSPMPLSSPRPRILVGGGGERKTLRLVAQYADACNLFGSAEEVAHKVDVLRRHCETVGRDPNEIEVTALSQLPDAPTPDDVVRAAEALAAVGVSTLVIGAGTADPAGWLESTFGPVVDRLAAIEAVPLASL